MADNNGLQKAFKTKDILALAFGTMIGWGWIMLSGSWANTAGMLGAILAYGVGTIFCIFIGLTYAELTPAIPCTGGSVVFSFKSMGYWAAVLAGIATSFAYLGVAAWEGPALASAIDYIVTIPKIGYLWTIQDFDVYASWALVAMITSVILIFINIRGAKGTAVFQTVATLGIIVVGILFVCGAVVKGSTEYAKPMFTTGSGFASVLLMVPAMFVGFDVIPQSAGEMNVPLKKIPKLLFMSICAAAAWYMLMILATCLSAPEEIRLNGEIPVADSMAYAFGHPVWGKICIVGALCGILTSWNGFLYGAARCIYSLAKAKMLPAFLADLHPKYNTPYKAIIFCGIICTFSCLLGKGALGWFVNASSFGVVIMYFMVALSFVFLRRRFPDMNRPYKIKHAGIVGTMAILVSAFFAYLYLPGGPSALVGVEWVLVLGYFAFFAVIAVFAKLRYKDVSNEEREQILLSVDE